MSKSLDRKLQALHAAPGASEGAPVILADADLGLYSLTPQNDAESDVAALEAYRTFQREAAAHEFRHFLEVFVPNVPGRVPTDLAGFLNDFIVRTLAAVPRAARPVFLKL